ncbi:hypothetical protein CAPTEDRAFT_18678 [Capitella teleta]|uniref:Putative treble-clef zinc-finger domain-containing protein n=1 Tax=Capitella teleta TaxID=283909 RepID=R7VDT3_CAPTE|nr:hypothetical protein CAPTEDRAFT_18678 [Capitella teleta]|eukprot:ELU13840.1 hypothetical protein CAPTEDRAFT_18678 [Capitella teleta]
MAASPGKVKNILFNLGKPTLRGVRKCPKCGTLNGTRGISCKNKGCDMVFKEKDRKRGHSADAVKIITDMDGNPAENVDADVLAGAAHCYVDPCSSKSGPCNHIRLAIECDKAASPLSLKNSVLNSLALMPDVKQALWMLATETAGPLVQRVTKDIMVVKCQVSVKTPLGFLHCSFFENRSVDNRFQCGCRTALKVRKATYWGSETSKSGALKGVKEDGSKHCIHYYACLCALASDDKLANEFATYLELDSPPVENEGLSLTFNEWLGSVTERVNQTMHYQFDGSPDPLVFHSPQKFFDILQHRISTGNRKRRLPNSTTGFIRKDALPLGTFTKYTWHITNILHVKQIFDTPGMPLRITRSFVENRDGTFDSYEPPLLQTSNDGTKNITPIRPFELKTYLKVGNTARDQTEPTPFIIEWIPDILPHSRIGELRIKFEYGHERNGQIEHRSQPISASVVAL